MLLKSLPFLEPVRLVLIENALGHGLSGGANRTDTYRYDDKHTQPKKDLYA